MNKLMILSLLRNKVPNSNNRNFSIVLNVETKKGECKIEGIEKVHPIDYPKGFYVDMLLNSFKKTFKDAKALNYVELEVKEKSDEINCNLYYTDISNVKQKKQIKW